MSKNKRQWTGGEPSQVNSLIREAMTEKAANLPVVQPSCLNCDYRRYNGAYFECRRFPPPHQRVEPNGWCGEHKSA